MEPLFNRKKHRFANKLLKFGKKKFSYDNLFYDLLYDFAHGTKNIHDPNLFKFNTKKMKKKYPVESNWYKLYCSISSAKKKVNVSGIEHEIPVLGYKYILLKAKIKFMELHKEALKINRPVVDIVRLYTHSLKQKKMNASLEKFLNIGNSNREVERKRTLNTNLISSKSLVTKMLEKKMDNEIIDENEEESKIH